MDSDSIRQIINGAMMQHVAEMQKWSEQQYQEWGAECQIVQQDEIHAWPVVLATRLSVLFEGNQVATHVFQIEVR